MAPVAVVALLVSIPWRWLPSFEVGPLARETTPRAREEHPLPERTSWQEPAPKPPTSKLMLVPDEVVIRTIEASRAAFLGCWRRALKADPMLDATKVTVRVELNPVGTVLNVTHDATNERLGNCLAIVARGMSFAAPMDFAVAEFPLFFRPE